MRSTSRDRKLKEKELLMLFWSIGNHEVITEVLWTRFAEEKSSEATVKDCKVTGNLTYIKVITARIDNVSAIEDVFYRHKAFVW